MEGLLTPLVLFVAALVQGFLGFGFGIIAMGGLTLGSGVWHAAGVVNVVGLIQTGTMVAMLHRGVMWWLVARILLGSVFGIWIGLTLLDSLDLVLLQQVLGLVIFAIAVWNLSPWRPGATPSPLWDAPVGLASGLLNGLFNTGGPPLVAHVYRMPHPPDVLKGTVTTLFVCTIAIRLPGAWAKGMLTGPVWRDAAISAVFVLLGTLLGVMLARRVDPERFRRVSWAALAVLGLGIAWVS